MSINPNVGGMSRHLARLRSKPGYYHFKKWYRRCLEPRRTGSSFIVQPRRQNGAKKALLPGSTLFEDMGFTYLGPVDGHDVDRLTHAAGWASELRCPVLLHVNTVKGKGYPSPRQIPDRFHGVAPFDPLPAAASAVGREFFQRLR